MGVLVVLLHRSRAPRFAQCSHRTYDSLGTLGARRRETELAEVFLALRGEGVEPRFGCLRGGWLAL